MIKQGEKESDNEVMNQPINGQMAGLKKKTLLTELLTEKFDKDCKGYFIQIMEVSTKESSNYG